MYAWLTPKLLLAHQQAERLGVTWLTKLGDPTGEDAIISVESQLGVRIPLSMKAFLSLYNGAFFGFLLPQFGEDSPFGITIFSIEDLLLQNLEYRAMYAEHDVEGEPPFWGSLLAIAKSGGCGDLCLLDPDQQSAPLEYAVLDGFNETPDSWRTKVIAGSFDEWLMRMLDSFIERGETLDYWIAVSVQKLLRD